MQIDRRAERVGALPERIELGGIEILSMCVAVDHGAAEFQFAHTAFELVGCRFRVLHGQVSEAGIAIGPPLNFTRKKVVRLAHLARGGGGIPLDLHARARDRQDRSRDAGAIHALQAQLAKIGQIAEEVLATLGRDFAHRRAPVVDKAGREEVFFKRDLLDHGLPHCDARRPSASVRIPKFAIPCS
jgi:hypothetical protein